MKDDRLIYVVCPDRKKPIGGVKQLYRLVDTLNEGGYRACIVHGKRGFRATWFENSTPVKYFPYLSALLYHERKKKKKLKMPLSVKGLFLNKTMPEPESILVFPEVYGPHLNQLVPDNEVVIFNQNCYYTFEHYPLNEKVSPYRHPNTLGCLVVSADSQEYLRYTFPDLCTLRIRLGISRCFTYSENKKKQIAFMPRKLEEDFLQIYHILAQRMDLSGWTFKAIDNLPETEVAAILQESAIFLCLNYQEGFGLPPVEAMSCGCYVIGYTGHAGKEYLDPAFCSPIEGRDVIAFAREIERIVNEFDLNPAPLLEKGKQAAAFVRNTYNAAHERDDILSNWRELLKHSRKRHPNTEDHD